MSLRVTVLFEGGVFGCSESLGGSALSEGLGVLGQKGACGKGPRRDRSGLVGLGFRVYRVHGLGVYGLGLRVHLLGFTCRLIPHPFFRVSTCLTIKLGILKKG